MAEGYDWSQVTFEDLVDWIPGGLSNLPEAASESLRSCEGFYLGVSAMTQALMVGADGMFQIGSAAVDGEASVSDASIAFSQWSDAALMVAVTNKDIFETGPGPEAEQYLRDLSDLFGDAVASASLIGLFGFDVDEDKVDEVLDQLEAAGALDGGGGAYDEGLAAQDVLSDLFLATDRLMRRADDADGVLLLVEAADRAEELALPYGFTEEGWAEITRQAIALRTAFQESVDDDDVITEAATDLRHFLRRFV